VRSIPTDDVQPTHCDTEIVSEFKQRRENLGLPASFMAREASVSEEIVRTWDDGLAEPSKKAIEVLEEYEEQFEINIQMAVMTQAENPIGKVGLIKFKTEREYWEYNPHSRGVPLSNQDALIEQMRKALEAIGTTLIGVEFNRKEYDKWLKKKGMENNPLTQAMWANSQIYPGE
jgi:hypothetical protein